MTEVEIKVSKSDLKNDFKKPKHRIYKERIGKEPWIPSKFYFAVPSSLKEFAVAQVVDKPYGVIEILDNSPCKTKKIYTRIFDTDEYKNSFIAQLHRWHKHIEDLVITKDGNTYTFTFNVVSTLPLFERVRVVKRAKFLHKNKVNSKVQAICVARLSSEMAGLRQKLLESSKE